MSSLKTMFGVLLLTLASVCALARTRRKGNPTRFITGRVFVSTRLPDMQVQLSEAFHYIGKFDFTIPEVAEGERFIFAAAQGRRIEKLFIFQWEAILPQSTITYNYSFTDALAFGGHRFRQNTFAFSDRETKREHPAGEAGLTSEFLKKKGFLLEDELMASRFVTVPDAERKHELILFYIETIRASGHRLQEFYEGDTETPIWKEISRGLTERSLEHFSILR